MLTVSEIIATVTSILQAHGVKEAILFGSYAKGCATENSDVDLYVDSGLCGIQFYGLLGDIIDAFSIPVDLFDKRMLERNITFRNEIKRTGLPFHYD